VGETVYSFGHVLYEMCAGRPLKKPLMNSDTCPRGFQPDAGEWVWQGRRGEVSLVYGSYRERLLLMRGSFASHCWVDSLPGN